MKFHVDLYLLLSVQLSDEKLDPSISYYLSISTIIHIYMCVYVCVSVA
jgi:hypothetical protein